jgi:hypothetical protein
MQAYNKKDLTSGSIAENSTQTWTTIKHDSAPRLPNCNPGPPAHMSYPCSQNQIELICLTPVAKPNRAHRLHPCIQTNQTQYSIRPKPIISQLIMLKVRATHDPEHDYHDSLHFAGVAQLYS